MPLYKINLIRYHSYWASETKITIGVPSLSSSTTSGRNGDSGEREREDQQGRRDDRDEELTVAASSSRAVAGLVELLSGRSLGQSEENEQLSSSYIVPVPSPSPAPASPASSASCTVGLL
ncbi:hypothetical protein E2562_024159 [Oryza meyeriana var. granulata]|uniref:Uncharacterized protein n=1 Tax=Oryza meyeriana var. granulata TaxID=110450 RepID=A0A6G1EP92_9ORYZ|nr:hypothetical protein E2562_024159 [Oryza meyeriana var. granulata]